MANFNWSEEAVEKLRTLWDQGLLETEIAARFGLSENAISGKASRLRLPKRQIIRLGARVWTDAVRAIVEEDYPAGVDNEMIARRIKNECGIVIDSRKIRSQANVWKLKRPRWFAVEMGKRTGPLAQAIKAPPAVPVVVGIPASVPPTADHRRRYPVQGFSMLGGTIRT